MALFQKELPVNSLLSLDAGSEMRASFYTKHQTSISMLTHFQFLLILFYFLFSLYFLFSVMMKEKKKKTMLRINLKKHRTGTDGYLLLELILSSI